MDFLFQVGNFSTRLLHHLLKSFRERNESHKLPIDNETRSASCPLIFFMRCGAISGVSPNALFRSLAYTDSRISLFDGPD